ncbi:MAG: phosphoglucosamine mutase [Pseudomonadota bacterium]
MKEDRRKIFGTDGVRGKANIPPMDPESIMSLGRAAASLFINGTHKHRIVIGKDTRQSGYMIEQALATGICSAGADVLLVGPIPTPGVAFITRSMRADAGVMISASHNPYSDNGIKFFDRDGYKLSDDLELQIEGIMAKGFPPESRPVDDHIGRAKRIEDALGRYIQFLKNTFPQPYMLDDFRIVVDCANGSGYIIAPSVFCELGASVVELGTSPNGTNINQNCGSLNPERMCELVRKTGANVGVALDGDADRLIMCDEKGTVVDGDVIMALCAERMKAEGKLNNNTLVATVMSNIALDRAMAAKDIKVVRTKVGDRYVIEKMKSENYNLGGEQSGHMIFLDHNTTGDGIMGALQVLYLMLRHEKPLSELANIFEPYPQVLVNVKVKEKRNLNDFAPIAKVVTNYEKELGEAGRLLIRYSGTENIARIMVEGESIDRIRTMARDIAGTIEQELGVGEIQ